MLDVFPFKWKHRSFGTESTKHKNKQKSNNHRNSDHFSQLDSLEVPPHQLPDRLRPSTSLMRSCGCTEKLCGCGSKKATLKTLLVKVDKNLWFLSGFSF